ncbi:hypothetical protein PILCRDRAFT_91694 [Piloderma croceum F 1598]|uniref:Uncharacterized protein n=1 Tax=Piloderma croceum (strain F 1598) TaxID=765440 RepID=A0A0C3F8J8_PILCF|nr:hypothetical protein PILCRDRAFT_91694 [Piloderma croceum F 1598]
MAQRWRLSTGQKKMHYLTDNLLGLTKDNDVWKVAFGFNKGDVKLVNSGGKKIVEHHKSIAEKLFIMDSSGKWDGNIKKAYMTHHNMMSENGQGLLDGGLESDLIPGSNIKNVWDAIDKVFPCGTALNLDVIMRSRKDHVGDCVGSNDELESASRIQTEGKTTHQEIKEGKCHKTALDIEHSCVSHAREEAECQHQHEIFIWEKKLELAHLQAGVLSQSAEPSQAQSFTSLLNNISGVQGSSFCTHSSMSSSSGGHCPSTSTSEGPFSWGAEVTLPEYADNVGSGDN